MSKTAVEWLVEQLKINNYLSENAHWLIDDAKEMEKQHIIDAYIEGYSATDFNVDSEQYYNEKFKK